MYITEQNTLNKIMGDVRNLTALNFTCTKVESLNVTNTGIKLNCPEGTQYVVLQVVDGGSTSTSKSVRISECSTIPATSSLGIILGDLDIYDIKGSNNCFGASLCSVNVVTNVVNVQYYIPV